MKPSVLALLPGLPRPDTNAGDWRTEHILRALARDRAVTVVPLRDHSAREGRAFSRRCGCGIALRHEDVPGYLRAAGQSKRYHTLLIERYFDLRAEMFVSCFPAFQRVIIDVHEPRYLKEARMRSVLGRADRAALFRERRSELSAYRFADTVLTVSGRDREEIASFLPHKSIECIETGVEIKPGTVPGFAGRSGMVFIGYFEHPPNPDAVKYFLDRVMPLVREQLPGAVFSIAGHGSEVIFKRQTPQVRVLGRVENMPEFLEKFRVFVCPLRYGAGIKKKICDAVAAGTPVVTSPSGAEGLEFLEGQGMMIARSPAAFAGCIRDLYTSPVLWKQYSARGRAAARRYLGMEKFAERIVRLCGGRR